MLDIESNTVVIDEKVMNEAIMVITQCSKSGNLLLCTYDGKGH